MEWEFHVQGKTEEIDEVLSALASIYSGTFLINLKNDSYSKVQATKTVVDMLEGSASAQQAINMAIHKTVSPDEINEMLVFVNLSTLSDRMEKEKTLDKEYKGLLSGWVRGSFIEVERDENGALCKVLYAYQMVDEERRKELESALADSERERRMLDALCIKYTAAYYCDLMSDYMRPVKQRNFSHVSREKNKLSDRHCYSEWIRHAFDTFVVKESAPDYLEVFDAQNLMKRLQTEESIVYRHKTLPNGAGMEYFEATIVPLYKDENSFKVIIGYCPIDDIVREEKKIQEELRAAYQAAEKANEAKTAFLLNMSHDIRTPMNAILGYSQLMRERITDPELIHYQEMIEKSGNLLLSIINNVLDMARIESGKMELDENYSTMGDIVSSVCGVFEMEAAKKNLTVKHVVEVEHTHVICDSTKMQEIFTNIISNAIKYTPAGGNIKIVTKELPCEREGYINVQTVIEDTGIGMSEEFLPQLFESFSRERDTTSAKVVGSGLGMAIVKSLIELMGGTIRVESKLGKGTKFTVTVPHKIADAEYYEKKTLIESDDTEIFVGKHILLAEDNELNAEIASAILEDMGFTIDLAEDGIVCIDKLEKAEAGTYDLILMDIQMPNMDGYKATQMIRCLPDRGKADIPIIAMTANAFAEDRKKAFETGMNGHIAKPMDVTKLKETLIRILV